MASDHSGIVQQIEQELKALESKWRSNSNQAGRWAAESEANHDGANAHAFRKERRIWTTCADQLAALSAVLVSLQAPKTVHEQESDDVENERVSRREHAVTERPMGARVADAGVPDLASDSGRVGSVQGQGARDQSRVVAPPPTEPVEPDVVPLDDPNVPESLVPIPAAPAAVNATPAETLQDVVVALRMGAYQPDWSVGPGMTAQGCLELVDALETVIAASVPASPEPEKGTK